LHDGRPSLRDRVRERRKGTPDDHTQSTRRNGARKVWGQNRVGGSSSIPPPGGACAQIMQRHRSSAEQQTKTRQKIKKRPRRDSGVSVRLPLSTADWMVRRTCGGWFDGRPSGQHLGSLLGGDGARIGARGLDGGVAAGRSVCRRREALRGCGAASVVVVGRLLLFAEAAADHAAAAAGTWTGRSAAAVAPGHLSAPFTLFRRPATRIRLRASR